MPERGAEGRKKYPSYFSFWGAGGQKCFLRNAIYSFSTLM